MYQLFCLNDARYLICVRYDILSKGMQNLDTMFCPIREFHKNFDKKYLTFGIFATFFANAGEVVK